MAEPGQNLVSHGVDRNLDVGEAGALREPEPTLRNPGRDDLREAVGVVE
jgi:hypothetical protein